MSEQLKSYDEQHYVINFGPQHPSAHGVLRLVIYSVGELLLKIVAHIGLLHRGTEKLIEVKGGNKLLAYFDRLDYVSMMANEHIIALCLEQALKIKISKRAQLLRMLFLELTRLLNHLMAITTHAMDVGALTPFLWGFEEREKIFEFYERISGARMHAAFIRPGGLKSDIPLKLLRDIYRFLIMFSDRINELDELLTNNRIWKSRLYNVGVISSISALLLGFSGVLLRSTGISHDLRKMFPYELYKLFSFKIPIGVRSDCFERYCLRLTEMRISVSLMLLIIKKIPFGQIQTFNSHVWNKSRTKLKTSMENLISHFKRIINLTTYSNLAIDKLNPIRDVTVSVEAPKGEMAVNAVFDILKYGISRCRIKAPGFSHLQGIEKLSFRNLLADVVTIIGTQDIVFGEIDR